MSKVQTVLGSVDTTELGATLMHEHVCTSSMGVALHYPKLYHPNYMGQIIADLKELKESGYKTVVDASPVCLGRDVTVLRTASEKTGMNIIATSGFWGIEPPYVGPVSEEQWAKCFIDDCEKGCDGTDIKAGILKAAMDKEGPTQWRKKLHHAVGIASVETGKRIILHTYCPMETPRHQLDFLKEVGTDMNKVIVGHIPETTDLDFVKWIYDQGVWLGIDRLPIAHFPGDYAVGFETRIKFIKAMFDAGMGDRMLFSHDLFMASTLFDLQNDEMLEYLREQYPFRLLTLKKYVFPKLEEMGVDSNYLWNLSIENPQKFFKD